MSSGNDKTDAESENMCVVCCKPIEIYAIGCCDHPVCYECSTRMRVLCKQNECPICRQDMPKVIFTKEKDHFVNFARLTERHYLQERNFGMVFATQSVQKAYYRLLEHNCNICKQDRRWPFKNFNDLKDHMRKEHEQFYCELCVANLNIFTSERRSYSRAELGMHRRRGDTDNTSHRGHPLCEFCDTRYMDNDELFRHLRRDHFYCHFCDADGKHHYYNVYEDLRAHFLQDHFLCEEGNCKNEQFTSVFRSDIDLKAHQASVHSKDLGKFGTKQARTLEVAFTLAPRPGGNQNRRQQQQQQHQNRNNRGANDEEEGATGFDNYYMEPGGNRPGGYEGNQKRPVDPMNVQDFPQLGNAPNVSQSRPTSTVTFSKFTPKPFSGDDFPSLGGSSNHAPSTPNVTITAHSKVVASRANEVTITRTSKNQPNFAMRSQNFPALGGGSSGIGNSTVRLSISSGNGQSRPQSSRSNVSIHVRNPANVAITTRINTAPTSTTIQVRPKVTDFPALGGKVPAPPAQWVQQKSKKKETKQDMAKVNPAPVLPPSSLDFPVLQRGTTGTDTKTTKKRTSVTMPVSNSWVNLNNFNSENRNSGDRGSQAGNDLDLVELQNKKDEKNRGNNKGKKDQKQKKTTNKKKKGDNGETEPTTSTEEDVNKNLTETKSVNGIVKKVTELKIENVNGDNGYASGSETRRGPPPPGFTVKPPPGFVPCNNTSPSDLTFTNSSGQSFPILPTALPNEYRMPQNFERRNETLIRNFKEVMSDPAAISEFKNFSTLFRQDKYPAENYYRLCKEVLGTHFGKLFPELLVLLPDIGKQKELFRVHSANGGTMKDFELCLTCQQVLAPRDFREHISKHSLENNFPILSQQAQPTTNYWRK